MKILNILMFLVTLIFLSGFNCNAEGFSPQGIKVTKSTGVTFVIDKVVGKSGSLVNVAVKVSNFTDIMSFQGTISFDPQVLTYSDLSNFGIKGLNYGNFGTNLINQGKLTFSWYDTELKAETVADSTIIFSIVFSVKPTVVTETIIKFADSPTNIEVIDKNTIQLIPTLYSGLVTFTDNNIKKLSLKIDSVAGGSTIIIPVRCFNFNGIISVQGTITYDNMLTTPVSIEQASLTGLTDADFGFSQAASGALTFSWYDQTLKGITLDDNTVLFAIKFSVSGVAGSKSIVAFTDLPTKLEFVNKDYAVIGADLTNGLLSVNNNSTFSISGRITYDNAINTPLSGIKVYRKLTEIIKQDSTTTDANGNYQFLNVVNGTYIIEATTDKPSDQVDPGDALSVNRNYIGVYDIPDLLRQQAADVNLDGQINPGDALAINRRYIGMLPNFPAGVWLFEKNIVTVSDGNFVNNFKAICVGDVNASYLKKK